jgi:muramoyltetrapeptide carboxypeptidase
MQLRRSRALKPGDTIAVVAPSSPVSRERLEDGVKLLREWGFNVRLMPSTATGRGYLAGKSDVARAADLIDAFADPEVAGIICVRGGYGAQRLLPLLDWDVIRANPKPFCGYSDVTALHLAIRKEAGFVTFHGPMASRQGDERELHPWTAAGLKAALTSTAPLGVIASPPDGPTVTTVCAGRATGPLTGGNLTMVASLVGTPWAVDARGCILLLEDTNESPYRVDRMLTQLLLSGTLDGVAGVVFGDSPDCDAPADDPRSFPLTYILADRLGTLGVPVIYGFPCGHTLFRATLPLGVPATLGAAGTLELLEPACTE